MSNMSRWVPLIPLAASMVPVKLSRDQAQQLIELLQRACAS
jgi:hypothetical protein